MEQSGTVLGAGAQWGADLPGAYSAAGNYTHCMSVSTELEGLTENLSLPCEILREKQYGHINFYLVENINIWLYVEYFNNKKTQNINYF